MIFPADREEPDPPSANSSSFVFRRQITSNYHHIYKVTNSCNLVVREEGGFVEGEGGGGGENYVLLTAHVQSTAYDIKRP